MPQPRLVDLETPFATVPWAPCCRLIGAPGKRTGLQLFVQVRCPPGRADRVEISAFFFFFPILYKAELVYCQLLQEVSP